MTSSSTVPKIFVGDEGTVFRARILDESDDVVNIGTATKLEMRFRKPGGVVVTKTASLESDGSDGIMRYVTVAEDIDTDGAWRSQGYVEFPGNLKYSSSIYKFTVDPILDADWTP